MNSGVRIAVLGAGTWGMALARMLSNHGHEVTVWSAIESEIDSYSTTRRHPNLPGMVIPDEVLFEKDLAAACGGKNIVLFAVPSIFVRSTARKASAFITADEIVVDVAKGLEPETFFTMSEIIKQELVKNPDLYEVPVVALSGPTHAEEVAMDMPTAIVAACKNVEAARYVQNTFNSSWFRVYTNTDIHGVELCGALKNIIALASGISLGLGYGDNAKAALITRGMTEIVRIGRAFGCRDETFYGLAGIGDLIVTATSDHSRNNRCGHLIGRGKSTAEAVKEVGMVVEGIYAIPAAMEFAQKYNIEIPIISGVDAVVNHGADPRKTVDCLMSRAVKAEGI